jgi:crotonobetainyl-CoA:carnitine CoA-transferase CaiB-like acyl-CoA transferase
MPAGVLDGVMVLEVAQYWMAPAAGAILADWGADVIKVENPNGGDPMRWIDDLAYEPDTVNIFIEQCNRGKRSAAIDISSPEGYEQLAALIRRADVFLTNYLEPLRQRLRIDVEHVRALNPKIIYARGNGYGAHGPDAPRRAYDITGWYSRSGLADQFSPADGEPPFYPIAMGDSSTAVALAGGVAAALVGRSKSGEPSVVDASLLATAVWAMSGTLNTLFRPRIKSAAAQGPTDPLQGRFKTKDERWIWMCPQPSDRYWPELCERMGRTDLLEDSRFTNEQLRLRNSEACRSELAGIFGSRDLDEWRDRLDGMAAAWDVVQTASEILDDPQVMANGYIQKVAYPDGRQVPLVSSPVQFDCTPPSLVRAPQVGEHNGELLQPPPGSA